MAKRKDEDNDFLVREEPEQLPTESLVERVVEAKIVGKLVETVNMYMAGQRVSCSNAQKLQYEQFLRELGRLQRGRDLQDIPLGDDYFIKKNELDNFVSSL